MDIVERLIAFRDHTGLTNSQFADKAGIPRPTLSQFLNGRNKRLSDDLTSKLHYAFPELNVLWLLFGEGDMVTDTNIQFSEDKIDSSDDFTASQPTEKQELHDNDYQNNQVHDLPRSAQISSGGMSFNNSEVYNDAHPYFNIASQPQLANITQAPTEAKRISSIMVFYSDNSYERFVPSDSE